MTSTTAGESASRLPQTGPDRAEKVLLDQVGGYLAELRALDADDWGRPTDCPAWTVREIAAHVAGALDEGAHLTVMIRHSRAARKRGGSMVDALNDCQVADRARATGPQLVAEIERLSNRAARKRRTAPRLLRRRAVPGDDLLPGSTFGYLFDVIYPRDVWMHRIDTARAAGRQLVRTESDTEIVGQVIRDLDLTWPGPAVVLELTGPGGGRWRIGAGEPVATARGDSVEYLRLLAGRTADPHLEITGDHTVAGLLREIRIPF